MTLLEYLEKVSQTLEDINTELDEIMQKVEQLGSIPEDLTYVRKV